MEEDVKTLAERALDQVVFVDDVIDDVREFLAAVDVSQLSPELQAMHERLSGVAEVADERGDQVIAFIQSIPAIKELVFARFGKIKAWIDGRADRKAARQAKRAARAAE